MSAGDEAAVAEGEETTPVCRRLGVKDSEEPLSLLLFLLLLLLLLLLLPLLLLLLTLLLRS